MDIGAFNILGPESRDRGHQADLEVLSESIALLKRKAIFVKQRRNTKVTNKRITSAEFIFFSPKKSVEKVRKF